MKVAETLLREKFARKPAVAEANVKVLEAGYNFGSNVHASIEHTYHIETSEPKRPGKYMDINGNKATAYGFIAAAEKAGLRPYLGSYPITPATDVLHELAKHKSPEWQRCDPEQDSRMCLGHRRGFRRRTGRYFDLHGPGVCLKSEAMNLAVMTELPLVVLNVQRGGPSTGLPTKSEQADLLQALYGRNQRKTAMPPYLQPRRPWTVFTWPMRQHAWRSST